MNRRRFAQWLALYAATSRWHTAQFARGAEVAQNDGNSFEPANVDDFQALAKAKLPPMVYDYITSGSTDQITLRENVAAFQRLQILPPILAGVGAVNTSTTVLKQRVKMPILLAPVAAQRLYHPEGAKASARAATALGTIQGVSSSSANSVEEIAAASEGPKWLQLYPPRDRDVAERLVRRAEKAGYTAIIVTVDLGERKDADRRHRFALPEAMLRKHLNDVGFAIDANMSYADMIRYNQQAWDTALSWEFFAWLRDRTRLPLLVKGVLRVPDAQKAVAIGLDGIVVSNHGGRRLDGMPASISCLPAIVAAVGGKTEIVLDSGVRRGTDVLKALALGAKAVLVGRPYAWALGADGERGVKMVMTLLHEEFTAAMHACGCATVGDIKRDLIVIPNV
jgi:isopentenyl diphosphate isomerase/L-lactate dehydrogenase-like FMN-dependent dehydrogenase